MKRTRMTAVLICALLLCTMLFASCGEAVSVASALVDQDGNLILTMSDGTQQNVGWVAGEDGVDGQNGIDAIAPQIRINPTTNMWEISTDGGKNWNSTDVNAKGETLDNPQGLDFYPLSDGTYAVSVGNAYYLEEINYPSTYKGKRVTKIVAGPQLTIGDDEALPTRKITIGANIEEIGIFSIGYDGLNFGNLECIEFAKNSQLKMIKEEAFYWLTGLKSIILPQGLICIEQDAFESCEALASAVLPSSLTEIGDYAFGGTVLSTVYYTGTEAQWNALSIDAEKNAELASATVYYYSETEPATGKCWHYVDGVPTPWQTT